MPTIDLGLIGATIEPDEDGSFVELAVGLEDLGYSTVWITGGPLSHLGQVADVVRATRRIRVATGILSVDRFDAPSVRRLHDELEADHPGRFVVGLGGAHAGPPLPTIRAYLDELALPAERIVLAALGPKMLGLARDRAAGAYPVLVTPGYVAEARSTLGPDTTLAIDQLVVLDDDPGSARTTARLPLGFLGTLPQYQASFRRQGLTQADIEALADPVVDALVAWGGVDAIAGRVDELQRAGADHVAVSVVAPPATAPLDVYRQLAGALLS